MTAIADIASRGRWRGILAGLALLAPLAACGQSAKPDDAATRAETAARRAEAAQHAAERAAAKAGAPMPAAGYYDEQPDDSAASQDDQPADSAPDSE